MQTNGMAVGDDGWTYIGAGSSADGGGLCVYDPAGVRTHGGTTGSCGAPILDAAENVYAWCDGAIVAYPKHLAGGQIWSFDLTTASPAFPQGMSVLDTVVIGQQDHGYFTVQAPLADGGAAQLIVGLTR